MLLKSNSRQPEDYFRLATLLGASATVIIGVLGLLGWALKLPGLTSFGANYIPIAVSTCIVFLIQGTILVFHARRSTDIPRWPLVGLAALTSIFGMLPIIGYFANLDLNLESALFPSSGQFAQFPINRMSPFTGLFFTFTGATLWIVLRNEAKKYFQHLAGALGIAISLAGLIGTIAYLHRVPLLYAGSIIPLALPTNAAFIFLGIALTAAAGPNALPLRSLTGHSIRAVLLRTFVPLGFLAVICSDILQSRIHEFHSALISAGSAVFFGLVTTIVAVQSARIIGGIIEKAEEQRKRADEELRRSREWFRTTLSSIGDAVIATDASGQVTFINPVAATLTGWHSGALGQPVQDVFKIINEKTRRHAANIAEKVLREGCIVNVANSSALITRDGREIPIEDSAAPIKDSAGNLVGVVLVFHDVTEKRRSLEMLRESEQSYRSLFENMLEGFAQCRMIFENEQPLDFEYLAVNRAYEDLTGLKNVLGKKGSEVIPGLRESNPELFEIYGRVASTGKSESFEIYLEQLKAWLFISVYSTRKGYFIVTCDNITERKRAEEERMRLVAAIEQAAEAIIITDSNWIIDYVNPAFTAMAGYDSTDIIGRPLGLLKSDKHDRGFYRDIRQTLTGGQPWSGRLTNRKKDGSLYETDVTASPVRNKSGAIINYVSIHRDITRQVKLERDLRQAQKMEAIGTLAGGIAHDFNNILAAIIGHAEIAGLRLAPEDPVRRNLDQVLKASARATDLVKRILAFSHQTEQKRQPVPIVSIVKEALKLLRPSLPTTIEIRREIALSPEEGVVCADPTEIHQVLMNLCTNAAHAMRARGGVLLVRLSYMVVHDFQHSLHPELEPGPYVCLAVSDTGHGIDPELMERIFDPFFTTKGIGEGTGLGLSVVQGIVRTYGGAIAVQSVPGKGTTFEVFLRGMEEQTMTRNEIREALPTGAERILFVDDEEILAELGQELLESLGYMVVAKTNSFEALETFRADPYGFDLVITDMTMPGLRGEELATEIIGLRPDMPVILCTGYSELINEKQARKMGIREFVMKPYVVANLAEIIRKTLNGNESKTC